MGENGLPSVMLGVDRDTAAASGATADEIEWSIRAEAEGAGSARCAVHVDGRPVADITVHEQPATEVPLVMEVQEVCAALVWSAIRAVRANRAGAPDVEVWGPTKPVTPAAKADL